MSNVLPFVPSAQTLVGDRIYQMPLANLYFIEPHRADDFRGFYAELQLLPDLEKILEQPFTVKQVNHARSERNVARGFHVEAWNKLVVVTRGSCACVWVDLRPERQTFGQAVSMTLGDGNGAVYGSVYVGSGIGNGYVVTDGPADYVYVTDALYRERDIQRDQAVSLFDPQLNIQWPVPRVEMILSQRDKQAVTLAALEQQSAR